MNLGLAVLAPLMVPLFVKRFQHKWSLGLALVFGYPVLAYLLFYGGLFGLPMVETHRWGGLMLTLVLAVVGMVLSLPLGIVQQAFADPKWLGYSVEGYLFAGLVYWMFCFGMSRYSQALERELHRGHEG